MANGFNGNGQPSNSNSRDYDHVVSLGPNCAMAYNLRRVFNWQQAFPFDWWVTEDALGFSLFLKDRDVQKLYDPNNLVFRTPEQVAIHKCYNIEFHHEFSRPGSRHPPRGLPDLVALDTARRRTLYLMRRMEVLISRGSRLLFVRATDRSDSIIRSMHEAFAGGRWEIVFVGRVHPGAFDWRGDPEVWDRLLRGLGRPARMLRC